MKSKDFEWLTDEFTLYCRSIQLREKLHFFGGCLTNEPRIYTVDR